MRSHAKAIVVISSLLALSIFAFGISAASAAPPSASIDAPGAVTYTTAQVSGTVDPADQDTYYAFQHSRDGVNWSTTEWYEYQGPVPANSGPQAVTGELTGLSAGVTYSVRLVVVNQVFGGDPHFSPEPNPTFSTDPVSTPSAAIDPVTTHGTTTAHFSGSIDPEASAGSPDAFDVEWQFRCTPECPNATVTEGTNPIPADDASHDVAVDVTGLQPGTPYEVSLVAKNAGDPVSAATSFETEPVAPTIKGILVSPSQTTAKLSATINPGGDATDYHFEYGPTASYGQNSPTGTIGDGTANVTVNTLAIGLTPGVTYHYRLVASNVAGTVEGPDRTFTAQLPRDGGDSCPNAAVRAQQRAQDLPECRAYEQVSPVDKNSADVQNYLELAADGRAVAWASLSAYADPVAPGGASMSVYAARRGTAGWQTRNMEPAANSVARPGAQAQLGGFSFAGDLSSVNVIAEQRLNPAEDDDSSMDVYRLRPGQQAELISHGVGGPGPGGPYEAVLVGSSRDDSSVFFRTEEKLDPAAPDGVQSLYRNRNGEVALVSRDEDGAPLPGGAVLGTGLSGPVLGSGSSGLLPDSIAVSPDGSSFVYRAGDYFSTANIYLREADGANLIVNRSQRSGEVGDLGPDGAGFAGASADLSTILFRSRDRLTDDAPVDGGLYVYSVGSEKLTFIGRDSALSGGGSAGVLRISGDGRRVYYVSRNFSAGDDAETSYLYVWSKGEGVRLVGPVDHGFVSRLVAPYTMPNRTNASISDEGEQLLFNTPEDVTGNEPSGLPQVYLYDYAADRVVCISCGPAGGTPAMAQIGAYTDFQTGPGRGISADGTRAVFTSAAQLLPEDTNAAVDAYLWTRVGGACTPASYGFDPESAGCIYLLSSGDSSARSQAIGISPDGEDIYIETRSALALTDTDRELMDVYSVRVGGGTLVPGGATPCAGETCKGPLSEASTQPSAGSAAFAGRGNEKPSREKPCKPAPRKGAKKSAKKSAKKRCGKPRKHKQQAGKGRKGGRK